MHTLFAGFELCSLFVDVGVFFCGGGRKDPHGKEWWHADRPRAKKQVARRVKAMCGDLPGLGTHPHYQDTAFITVS